MNKCSLCVLLIMYASAKGEDVSTLHILKQNNIYNLVIYDISGNTETYWGKESEARYDSHKT